MQIKWYQYFFHLMFDNEINCEKPSSLEAQNQVKSTILYIVDKT